MRQTQIASLLPILSVPGANVCVKLDTKQTEITRVVLLKVSIVRFFPSGRKE